MNNLLNIPDIKKIYRNQGQFVNYYTQRFMNNFFVELLVPPIVTGFSCDLMVFKSISNLLRYIKVDYVTLFMSFKTLNDQSLNKKIFDYLKIFLTSYKVGKKLEIINLNGQSFSFLFRNMFISL